MAWKYIQYEYPVGYNFEKFLFWISANCNCYFSLKDRVEDDWVWYSGNTSHGLDTGSILVSRTTETLCQTNYLTTTKDALNKMIAILPILVHARFVRMHISDASTTTVYEFRPSTSLMADEIITGTLEVTDQFSSPPLIKVTANSVDRIKIGKVGANYGIYGYNGSSNLIFELSDNQQKLAG